MFRAFPPAPEVGAGTAAARLSQASPAPAQVPQGLLPTPHRISRDSARAQRHKEIFYPLERPLLPRHSFHSSILPPACWQSCRRAGQRAGALGNALVGAPACSRIKGAPASQCSAGSPTTPFCLRCSGKAPELHSCVQQDIRNTPNSREKPPPCIPLCPAHGHTALQLGNPQSSAVPEVSQGKHEGAPAQPKGALPSVRAAISRRRPLRYGQRRAPGAAAQCGRQRAAASRARIPQPRPDPAAPLPARPGE